MKEYEVLWYEGTKSRERPVAIIINGKRVDVKDWKPLGVIKNFLGNEREIHKVKLANGLVFKIEYIRSLDTWTVEKSKNF